MKTEIERILGEEADFGDLVEITLKSEGDYCAIHNREDITVLPRNNGIEYQERGILRVAGYYGGMQENSPKETTILSDGMITPALIDCPTETMVCLNPTLHRSEDIDNLHYNGAGLVCIPVSAIDSYTIFSRTGRGLRVVN